MPIHDQGPAFRRDRDSGLWVPDYVLPKHAHKSTKWFALLPAVFSCIAAIVSAIAGYLYYRTVDTVAKSGQRPLILAQLDKTVVGQPDSKDGTWKPWSIMVTFKNLGSSPAFDVRSQLGQSSTTSDENAGHGSRIPVLVRCPAEDPIEFIAPNASVSMELRCQCLTDEFLEDTLYFQYRDAFSQRFDGQLPIISYPSRDHKEKGARLVFPRAFQRDSSAKALADHSLCYDIAPEKELHSDARR
jgi:hypothetical protein